MIKVEHIEVFNFEGAVRGLRNPMNSWNKSDSYYCGDKTDCSDCKYHESPNICHHDSDYVIGENDLDLMKRLYKAGTEHRKYLRQIMVSMDITAPLYWWKDFDTYKVGTVANSCSTMHKIHAKEFTLDDFSHEHLSDETILITEDKQYYKNSALDSLKDTIDVLNTYRKRFIQTKNKEDWWQLIQLLPTSYNQRRTLTMNYENVVTIIRQRSGHKLDEFNQFVEILKELPYVKEIMEIE